MDILVLQSVKYIIYQLISFLSFSNLVLVILTKLKVLKFRIDYKALCGKEKSFQSNFDTFLSITINGVIPIEKE